LSPQKGDHPPSHDDNFARGNYSKSKSNQLKRILLNLSNSITVATNTHVLVATLSDGNKWRHITVHLSQIQNLYDTCS